MFTKPADVSCEGQEFSMILRRGFLWWQSLSSSQQNQRHTDSARPGTDLGRRRCSLFPEVTHCRPAGFPGDRRISVESCQLPVVDGGVAGVVH